MAVRFSTLREALDHGFDDVIDVRSPAEFAEDRMPGAMSLPVLDDAERARVGTIYKQESAFLARKIGAALVARNAARHIETALSDRDGGWRPLVYCWRGGQRSGAFSAILREIGWRVETVQGGYRTWRRLVVAALYDAVFPAPVILIDGNTGSGKTEVLNRLSSRGAQSIDLEGLAGHRGSFLGALGAQPSQKAFESALATAVAKLDPGRPVVVEAESTKIGALNLPPALVAAMREAPRVEIRAPLAARASFLVRAYSDIVKEPEEAEARLRLLKRLRGGATVDRWVELMRAGEAEALAADLMTAHYDPAYEKSRDKREGRTMAVLEVDALDDAALDGLADRVAEAVSAA